MSKATYEYINETYYKLSENSPRILKKVFGDFETKSIMTVNANESKVISSICLNGISTCNAKTNKELYEEFVDYLKKNVVTQIDNLYTRYMVYIDYSVYDDRGQEIKHSVASKEIVPEDGIYPLGVNKENELVYRQVKLFSPTLDLETQMRIPYGIMQTGRLRTCYTMQINDVSIFQDKIERFNTHYSSQENCYAYGSHTIKSSLEQMILIYSTSDNGIIFEAMNIEFVPRIISVTIKLLLDNLLVAYDDTEINKILLENLDVDPSTPGGSIIPEGDVKPIAGSREPDEFGFSDYYEKCRESTPKAYRVVEDILSKDDYDPYTMIRKYMVIADIPDIEIGDYVRYYRQLDSAQLFN